LIIPGLFGRVSADREQMQDADCRPLIEACRAPQDSATVVAPGVAAGAVRGWCLAEGPLHCAITGNPDWLDYELADLQLKRGPAQAALRAYQRHGTDMLADLAGRFAVLIWDSAAQRGLIAADRFGQVPLYWAETRSGDLVFSPTADVAAVLGTGSPRIDEQSLFNYLFSHMVPGPRTIFVGVNKLAAGHALFCEGGRWHARRYWMPDFREDADASFADASAEMLGLLGSSVARLARGGDTGAFLSGGLDSSTVAGLLAQHQPRPSTYSIGFDAEGYDEIGYARIASERFDTLFKTYYVTPADVRAELPNIAAAYDEPFGNSSALPAYFCARLARDDGRTRLLAGDGGDELFAGNERYAKQTVFERYGRLPLWSRARLLEPLVERALPGQIGLVRKARSYIQQARVPLPDRLHSYNILNRLGARQVLSDHMLAAVDLEMPLQLERALYAEPKRASRLNRMLYLDWHHTLADNDLRKVNRMCELAGIEVEYPMLDDRLVEMSTRVSSRRKMPGNRLRDFYKKAVRGFLPDPIIDKNKHGFGLPFGVWMAEDPALQELAADNLARMRRRGYVRPQFIDQIVALHREQHAGYYGEFIWVLMMLELWLTAHGFEP
jgi:asparagine synthase (glutamine-hydrolysing)